MPLKPEVTICWFRRDLRLTDNAALYYALNVGTPVVPVFVFDTTILNRLEDKADKRVAFIHAALEEMQATLAKLGSTLKVYYGTAQQAFNHFAEKYTIKAVYTNHDYEGYGIARDANIQEQLAALQIPFHTYKDQVIFEKGEIVKDDKTPYTVFTPYSKKWLATLTDKDLATFDTESLYSNFFKQPLLPIPTLESMEFASLENIEFPSKTLDATIATHYSENRNFPAIKGTSRLGVHLRFGTISIRQLAKQAQALNASFLNELIWRDFYHTILWHFPRLNEGKAFKPAYDKIQWRNNPEEFEAWCKGKTGYPIVDAGMRELNATGFMHNRVRMIVASFLTKHLLIDWRWGEAYFAKKLLDFDFAANNGGWQWAAGSGCDAAPYFRVFNPALQREKFDKQHQYIKQWIPEINSFDYPQPIVQHEMARKRVLEVYKQALGNNL